MLEFESENSLLDSKPFATTNNKETFLQDFLQILKVSLQNLKKISKKYSLSTTTFSDIFSRLKSLTQKG